MLVVCLGIALEDACLLLCHFSKYSISVTRLNHLVSALSQTVTAISSVNFFLVFFFFCKCNFRQLLREASFLARSKFPSPEACGPRLGSHLWKLKQGGFLVGSLKAEFASDERYSPFQLRFRGSLSLQSQHHRGIHKSHHTQGPREPRMGN